MQTRISDFQKLKTSILKVKSKSKSLSNSRSTLLLKCFIPAFAVVKCDSKVQEDKLLLPLTGDLQEESFDWEKLFSLLSPDVWKLIVAVLVRDI